MGVKFSKTACGQESYWFWCEPCNTHHRFVTKSGANEGPVWTFDGNLESPTFSPSLLCNKDLTPEHKAAGGHRCHLFLRKGMVQYLGDCTHDHAGKTVPVQPPCF
jgi:hypothetical protein